MIRTGPTPLLFAGATPVGARDTGSGAMGAGIGACRPLLHFRGDEE